MSEDVPCHKDEECNYIFDSLGSELRAAIDQDELRARQNAAKFRALNQNVSTYDEFRRIVEASHLKPLDKSDKTSLSLRPKTIWNSFSSTKRKKMTFDESVSNSTATTITNSQPHTMKLGSPKTGHEFVNLWRRLGAAVELDERYALLKTLHTRNRLPTLFTSEACFGLLGEILCVLGQHPNTTDDFAFVVRTLELLTRMKRFNLSLQFLGVNETRECRFLFQQLRTEMRDKLQDLAEMYAITEWELQELERKYECNSLNLT